MISAVGLVEHLQAQLEATYDLRPAARVSEFLIDRRGVERLGGLVSAREEVFLLEHPVEHSPGHPEGAVDLGLYLAPELFERLRGKDPRQRSGLGLVTDELGAFTTVAEGVSHLVYLFRCLEHGRPVSKLELEVQAEVDKFAVSTLHLWGRGLRHKAHELWERLFVRARTRPGLPADERERYQAAGVLGGRYARHLLERWVKPGQLHGFLRDLRLMYRLSAAEKLSALAAI
jgi:hypothetical protein